MSIFLLLVAFFACMAALSVDLLLTQRPFASRPVSRTAAVVDLAAALMGAAAIGFMPAWNAARLGAAGAGVALGLGLAVVVHRSGHHRPEGQARDDLILPDSEVGRSKRSADRWVLVLGASGVGKTSLVDAMVDRLVAGPVETRFRAVGTVRTADYSDARVVEVPIATRSGDTRLRIWEATGLAGQSTALPRLDAFDAVVIVIAPSFVRAVGSSFPKGIRGEEASSARQEQIVPELFDALNAADVRRLPAWLVLVKADHLRLSTSLALVRFPIEIGPNWYRQMSTMQLPRRRDLAAVLGLHFCLDAAPPLDWGLGSPLVVFPGGAVRGTSPPFGAAELLDAVGAATIERA